MLIDRNNASRAAQQYFKSDAALRMLGWGVSGCVFISPDNTVAVKVLHTSDGFQAELKSYRRLWSRGITSLFGLTVPKLRGADVDSKIVAMDVVKPPYLLDFAGVRFIPPDFSADVMAHWHEQVESNFGPNSDFAYSVFNALKRHGMYYMDLRPSNLNLTGLPGLVEVEPPTFDDL